MAGPIEGFDPDEFREAISFAMTMGLPPVDADRPVFYFRVDTTSDEPLDDDGVPFAPAAEVERTPRKPAVRVPCGIEYQGARPSASAVGLVSSSRVTLTLLDVHYAQVEGFTHVVIGGVPYRYVKTLPPAGLGEVGVYEVVCEAEDDA